MGNLLDRDINVCPVCFSREFTIGKKHRDREGYVYEYEVVCTECGYVLGTSYYNSFEYQDEDRVLTAVEEYLASLKEYEEDKETEEDEIRVEIVTKRMED